MGGEWTEVQLGDVVINHDAKRQPVKESDRRPGPFPYYGASGVVDSVDGYNFDGEYVLIAEDGENLRTRQTPIAFPARGKFWVNNHAHVLSGSSRITTRFLLYALQVANIGPFITGAVMPKLTQASLHRIPLLLPCRGEQERIAELLSALDDKIELNRRMARTLEAMARTIFKSWFVDFEPVHAGAEGRSTGLSEDIASYFPKGFDGEGLPIGWSIQTVGSLYHVSGGNTPPTDKEEYWGGSYHWASPKDLSSLDAPVLLQTGRRLTNAGLAHSSSGLLPSGSLLLSSRAPIGYMAFTTVPTAINQGFAGITRKKTSTVYAWAWCHSYMDMIKGNAGGSTFPEISKSVFRKLPMLEPSEPVLEIFSRIGDGLIDRMVRAVQQQNVLANLRNTLLPKLISGELRVAAAEQHIAAA